MTPGKKTDILAHTPIVTLGSDYIFVIFPFLVWILIRFLRGTFAFDTLLRLPDWSFASAILAGYALVRLLDGFCSCGEHIKIEYKVFWTILLVVFCLAPSLIVLGHFVAFVDANPSQPLAIRDAIIQGVVFVLATLAFLLFGAWGGYLKRKYGPSKEPKAVVPAPAPAPPVAKAPAPPVAKAPATPVAKAPATQAAGVTDI